MPVYEYQCTECGEIKEAFQKISDPPLTTCSHCKGGLKKIISQSTFHLKGSGWYVTDYGGAKNQSKEKNSTKEKVKSKEPKTASKKTTQV
ncbi:MAG: zinc ribbon domain-containing protein [Thermodesulfobacteriota bacterium]